MNAMRWAPEVDGPSCGGSGPIRRPGVLVVIRDCRTQIRVAADLDRQGFDVWTAESGVGALRAYIDHSGEVDVLLLEADLPDLPAPAFLWRFRSHFPGVPCVFLAGRTKSAADALARAEATVLDGPITAPNLAGRLLEAVGVKAWVVEF